MCFLVSLLFFWILIPSVGLVLFVFGFFFFSLPVLIFSSQIAWFIYVLSPLVVSDFFFRCRGFYVSYCATKKFGTWVQFGELLIFSFVVVQFICARSVRGKTCYFWQEIVKRLGDAGLVPSLVQIVFVPYFPAFCVMLG